MSKPLTQQAHDPITAGHARHRRCEHVFHRQEHYAQHLRDAHGAPESEIRRAVNKDRKDQVDWDKQLQFWCGFCREVVPLNTSSLAGWDERADHIDREHFQRGLRIEEWLAPPGYEEGSGSGWVALDGARNHKPGVQNDAPKADSRKHYENTTIDTMNTKRARTSKSGIPRRNSDGHKEQQQEAIARRLFSARPQTRSLAVSWLSVIV